MDYEQVRSDPGRDKRKRYLLACLGTVLIICVVVAVVLGVLLSQSARASGSLKSTIINRCTDYLKNHPDESSGNDCEQLWKVFELAFLDRDPCDVPPENYSPFIQTVKKKPACNRSLFWTKTKDMVHAFTEERDCYLTMEDTLLGFMLNDLTWCGKQGSNEIFTSDCPGWTDCVNNTVRSFWNEASADFAATACGNVSVMMNGSIETPFSTSSIFGSVEVKNFNATIMNGLTVLLVRKETDTTTCSDPSLLDLKHTLDPRLEYQCKEVPQTKVQGCISDLNIPCSDCL